MEKISSFKILSLSVSGFKCFDRQQEFTFGDLTMISGANHVGKSSIADAIAFAIIGTTFYGEVHIDRLYSEQCPNIEVHLTLCDQDGAVHELVRRRKKDRVTISYDNYNVRQQDLNELFGDRDVFLSIFNPLYFIEELGDEGKCLLEKYLPFVDQKTVTAGISAYNQKLLADKDILAPENYSKSLRDDVRELRENIIACEGQASLLMTQRKESAQSLNLLKLRLDELEQEIVTLETKKADGISRCALQSQLDDVLSVHNELLSDQPNPPDTVDQERTLHDSELALERIKAKVYESKFTAPIAETDAALKVAYEEYDKTAAIIKRVQPGIKCPICLREITQEHLAAMKQELTPQLQEIVARGQGLKAQLADLRTLDKKSLEVFTQNRTDDVVNQQNKIAILKQTVESTQKAYQAELIEHDSKLRASQMRIQELQDQLTLGNLSVEENSHLGTLREEQRQAQADFTAQETLYKQQTDNTKDRIAELEGQIKQKELLISAVADYAAKRAELTFEKLSAGDVRFKLFEVMKTTGEVKDCFKFTYCERDYKRLSRSERILAGVSTAELIKQLTGRNYPVFIDDSESVLGIPKPTGQTFLARVAANAPLAVKVIGEPLRSQIGKAA